MNIKTGLLFLSLCFAAVTSMSIKDSIDDRWEDYKKNFHRKYAPEEEPVRKQNFEKNVKRINLNNEKFEKGEVAYKMVVNSFTDMDPADYNKMLSERGSAMFNVTITYPLAYDWRINETLSPVPNMGDCKRGDWAFAAVGMLEGYVYKMDKVEKRLSEQDLIECSGELGNMGCDAGDVKTALHYVEKYGILSSTSHPFVENAAVCDKSVPRDGIHKGWEIKPTVLNPKEEGIMQWYISSKSPITAKMAASKRFLEYKEEIFTGGDCSDEENEDDAGDYNVLIIGYGEMDSKKFWIVKNWMGENWGDKGYAKVARGENNCDGDIFSKVVAIESIKKPE